MPIQHDEAAKQFVLLAEDGTHMGELEYKKGARGDLYALHTEVSPAYSGQGYAGRLLDALVAYAVEQDAKIIPVCSYAIKAFERHPEKYAAVIKPKK